MEKLKSVIPQNLKHKISVSTPDDLHSTCSSLLNFFHNLPLFHQIVGDLTDTEMALCGKNKEAALEAKASGNECFAKGGYRTALCFYSKALRVAPADAEDMKKSLIATLYVNRASTLHKLGLFSEGFHDCNRALTICPVYAKAWFRRGKANISLGNYRDAINDLNVSLKMETSLSGKRQIQSELSMILDQSLERSSVLKPNGDSSDELLPVKLQCVSTPTKGREMVALGDIPQGSLIHKEEPYAAIILKHCRETHCHFCFNELPEDTVPCVSCSIPLYCSTQCQVQAGGQNFSNSMNDYGFQGNLSDDIEDYIRRVTSVDISILNSEYTAEHTHECCGVHWPAVLPADVVLAGRVLVKYIQQHTCGWANPNFHGVLDLCHNYEKLSGESKLEYHVYSITLLCSLQQRYASKLPLNSTIASQIIILLSQIRINSMGIAHVKFSDSKQTLNNDGTSSVEQVRVAQAVYSSGSLFNHSCQPNVHTYFLSRTLFIRATEHVAAGSQLELSYGPQVGQWDCGARCKFLEDRYSFICQCSSCAQPNLSDLVIKGYRCTAPNCMGVVLDSSVAKWEKEKLKHFEGLNSSQGCTFNNDDIKKVASCVFEQSSYSNCFEPGQCLSCGSSRDLQSSQKAITEAGIYVKRLQKALASGEIPNNLIMDASKYLHTFRTILHPFNKRIAEVEDNIAQALCSVGDMRAAVGHCQASVEILEKLYGTNHIAIGHELIKLATIQLSVRHERAADNLNRLVAIFAQYYGMHAKIILPHLPSPEGESSKAVQ